MITEEIIQGCKEGSRKSQDALVQKSAPALFAICVRYLRNYANAQDTLQDTYINIFQNISSYRAEGQIEAWMRMITIRNCIYALKKQKTLLYVEEGALDNHLQSSCVPDIYSQLSLEAIMEMISSLPPSLAAVFNLYIIDGYKHNEIAEILGISDATSRAALNKARMRMIDKMNSSEKTKILTWASAL